MSGRIASLARCGCGFHRYSPVVAPLVKQSSLGRQCDATPTSPSRGGRNRTQIGFIRSGKSWMPNSAEAEFSAISGGGTSCLGQSCALTARPLPETSFARNKSGLAWFRPALQGRVDLPFAICRGSVSGICESGVLGLKQGRRRRDRPGACGRRDSLYKGRCRFDRP